MSRRKAISVDGQWRNWCSGCRKLFTADELGTDNRCQVCAYQLELFAITSIPGRDRYLSGADWR